MQLTISSRTPYAKELSHLLAKNPQNVYERSQKGHLVRLFYQAFDDDFLKMTIFVTPDPLALLQQKQHVDITHYINDRQFAVSSIFLSLIRNALSTALNGQVKPPYDAFVQQPFPLTFHLGPVVSPLDDDAICALFTPLGYRVEIEHAAEQSRARFLTLHVEQTLQTALRQLFIFIPVIDDYKHYYIDETEQHRLQQYGEGWLHTHPQEAFIRRKTLRFASLIPSVEPKQTLADVRYDAIVDVMKQHRVQRIVDFGAGEGKLTEKLAQLPLQALYAVDPSVRALQKLQKRFADAHVETMPRIQFGSLYFYDEAFHSIDAIVLCEVIEHIDEARVADVLAMLTTQYVPRLLVVTTPNAEYNVHYAIETKRHHDHRFEWTRAQFEAWCKQAGDYDVSFTGIGEERPGTGHPTQMAIFTRRERT